MFPQPVLPLLSFGKKKVTKENRVKEGERMQADVKQALDKLKLAVASRDAKDIEAFNRRLAALRASDRAYQRAMRGGVVRQKAERTD